MGDEGGRYKRGGKGEREVRKKGRREGDRKRREAQRFWPFRSNTVCAQIQLSLQINHQN